VTLAPDEIRRIVEVADASGWDELRVTVGETTLLVSKTGVVERWSPAATIVPAAALHVVEAPSVGVFRRGDAPGGPPVADVGDAVEAGATLGSVAVMKTTEPVTSGVAGTVTAVHVGDGEPVEYGWALFTVEPTPA
jgi:acetyl-CoA carboxylase biotin carboxyl carrier protein